MFGEEKINTEALMVEEAYRGNSEKVLDFCKKNQNFSKISGSLCNNIFTVNLLGAAILGGNIALVKKLLDMGFNIDADNNTCWISKKASKEIESRVQIPLLMLVFCLGNPRSDWQIKPNKVAAKAILQLLIKGSTPVKNKGGNSHSLVVTSDDLKMGLEFFRASPEDILYLVNTLEELDPDDFPLELAVNTGALPLVEKMLSLGTDIDSWFVADEHLTCLASETLESGFTPLLVAIANNNERMVRLLLEHNAQIEQEFCAS